VLDSTRLSLEAEGPQLRPEHLPGALRLAPGGGVREDLVAVPGDGEPTAFGLAGDFSGLVVQLDAEPFEQMAGDREDAADWLRGRRRGIVRAGTPARRPMRGEGRSAR
jgi:hypothetical protein